MTDRTDRVEEAIQEAHRECCEYCDNPDKPMMRCHLMAYMQVLIETVRAEQPQRECFHCGLPYSEKPEQPQDDQIIQFGCGHSNNVCQLHEAPGSLCMMCLGDLKKKAAQPQQAIAPIGHVARCVCHDADECEEGVLGPPCYNNHPHTDPRCLPSLLREAEVRLEEREKSVHDYVNRTAVHPNKSPGMILDDAVDEARAAVDRLRAEMKDAKPTAT